MRHHRATVKDIESVARLANAPRLDDVATFYSELAGHEGPFLKKPVLTELAFTDRDSDRPSAVTFEFPLASYVKSDAVACERILSCMAALGIPSDQYQSAIDAFATRPLSERAGIHAHVTLRHVPSLAATILPAAETSSRPPGAASRASAAILVPRLAVYFTSEAYPVSRGV